MANFYKTGAVAVTIALKHICIQIRRFGPVLITVIDKAQDEHVIDASQAVLAKSFLSGAQAACDVFRLITGY